MPLPAAPAVFRVVPYRRFPFGGSASFLPPSACPVPEVGICLWCFEPCSSYGACGFAQLNLPQVPLWGFLLLPARLLLWWRSLGCRPFHSVLSASPVPAGLPLFGVLHPVLGFCPRGCLFSLYGILVIPYGSPRLSGLVCWSIRFPLLQGGGASGLRVWRPALAAPFVQSLQLFFVGSPSAVPVCPPQALVGQVVWSQSFPPSCCSWRLCSLSVSAAAFCSLAFLLHPLLLLLLAWGSSSGVCSGLGW